MKEIEMLKEQIEKARKILDESISKNESSELVYTNSVELDKLIEKYIMMMNTKN